MNRLPNKDFYNFKLYADLPDRVWMETIAAAGPTTVVVIQQANETTWHLLDKILGAVQQDLKKDCLVLQQEQPALYKDIKQVVNLQRLLVFGWSPADLGLHLQLRPYQLATFEETQLLFSHNLAAIAANKNKEKQHLWVKLQELFK